MPGRLILRRPSPTTVSFTVSNASRHTSTPAKVLFYLQVVLRVLSFFCVLLLDVAKLRHSSYIQEARLIPWAAVWSTPLGASVCGYADRYSYPAVGLVSAIVMYGVFRKGYTGLFDVCGCCLTHPAVLTSIATVQKSRSSLYAGWASRLRHPPARTYQKRLRDSYLPHRSRIL